MLQCHQPKPQYCDSEIEYPLVGEKSPPYSPAPSCNRTHFIALSKGQCDNAAMDTYLAQISAEFDQLILNAKMMLYIILFLFGIQIINWLLGYRLNYFGNYPRHARGLPGVFISPFLHGNFQHFFMNAFPLFVLGTFVMQAGLIYFYWLTAIIIFLSGSLVWLLGRKAIHVGASGVIMGWFSFLLFNAYYHPSASAIILGLVTLYYFASLFLGLFPEDETTSWEGHVFGFISGISAIYLIPILEAWIIKNFT